MSRRKAALGVTLLLAASCVSGVAAHDASVPAAPNDADSGVEDAGSPGLAEGLAAIMGRSFEPPAPQTLADLRNCSSRQACELSLGSTSFNGEPLSLLAERVIDYEHGSATGGIRAFTFLVALAERDGGTTEQWRLMIGMEESFWRDDGPPHEVAVVDEPFLRPDGGLAVRSVLFERAPEAGPLVAPPGRATRVPREVNLQPYRGIVIPANLKPRRIKPGDSCLSIGHASALSSEGTGPLCLESGEGCFTVVNGCRAAIDVEGFVAHLSWKEDREGHPAGSKGTYAVNSPCVIPAGGWAYLDDSIEFDRLGFALWRPRCSVQELGSPSP